MVSGEKEEKNGFRITFWNAKRSPSCKSREFYVAWRMLLVQQHAKAACLDMTLAMVEPSVSPETTWGRKSGSRHKDTAQWWSTRLACSSRPWVWNQYWKRNQRSSLTVWMGACRWEREGERERGPQWSSIVLHIVILRQVLSIELSLNLGENIIPDPSLSDAQRCHLE